MRGWGWGEKRSGSPFIWQEIIETAPSFHNVWTETMARSIFCERPHHEDFWIRYCKPGDPQGITKYHSDQKVSCWKQWLTDELVDVLCPSRAYEKVFWWFLDLSQFASNWPRMLDKKIWYLTHLDSVNGFETMSSSFGDSLDLESPGMTTIAVL